jgi:hypothetical protein
MKKSDDGASAELGIQVKYDVVHNLIHDKLKASLKVARSKSNEQEPDAVKNFKKELPKKLNSVVKEAHQQSKKFKRVRFWCEDETRLGLRTIRRRLLTAKGRRASRNSAISARKVRVQGEKVGWDGVA